MHLKISRRERPHPAGRRPAPATKIAIGQRRSPTGERRAARPAKGSNCSSAPIHPRSAPSHPQPTARPRALRGYRCGTTRGRHPRAVARFPGASAWNTAAGTSVGEALGRGGWERRSGDKQFCLACSGQAARDGLIARRVPRLAAACDSSQNTANLRRNCDLAPRRPMPVVDDSQHRTLSFVVEKQQPCAFQFGTSKSEPLVDSPCVARYCPTQLSVTRASESSRADPPQRSSNFTRALAVNVFMNLCAPFRQKIIWALRTCRVELKEVGAGAARRQN